MKIIIAAIALAIAAPAAAQTAPMQGHQGHDQQQQQQGHDQHGQMPGHGEEGGCCADRDGDGRMDCCQHMAQAGDRRDGCQEHGAQPSAQPQAHQGQ
jgi:hypothetical protein